MDFQSIALPTELRYLLRLASANIERILIYPKHFFKKIYPYLCLVKHNPMLLAIDIGNTRIKCAVFKEDTTLETIITQDTDLQKEIENILSLYPKITDIIVASVGNITRNDFTWIAKSTHIHFITHQSKFPFTNQYKTPHTLGIDRMILASGATLKFPAQNKLIIDAGTA